MTARRFGFAFAPAYRIPALAFGVAPATAWVEVDGEDLRVRFGLWQVRTPVANVRSTSVEGPYRYLTTAGPARLSLADRGLTFATNGERGVCVQFIEPVPGIEPTGRLRHPNLTVTVADCAGLAQRLCG